MAENNYVIDTRNLYKIYQNGAEELTVLNDVSIKVYPGDFMAILGPSGSGKSTLMNILGCLDKPSSGEYYLDSLNVLEAKDDELAEIRNYKIGFVFQQFNLLPRLSALQNVSLPLLYRGISEKDSLQKARETLSRLGLEDRLKHHPNELSGGQQQRVAIARAMVTDPHLLLADEPTGNLDSKSSQEVMKILHELHDQGHTIVVITHDQDIARQTGKVIYIRDGKVYEN
ncbi:MAG TPA: ABC transporter ATP-binding protein [Syntrophomonadaceae bacterium]|nr:ABC transporter ATP-binding protein [Syntrophomonadaceae bacterium]HNX28352.1 ABC transporter ATP-binding protein [Syntrophomonadaceae bacterium]HPR92716.1 ABC transporter ATP-binding protein [Syntrophomonadaceae bacterium]